MINNEVDKVVKELFDLLKSRYQNNLESMKDSEFVFDYLNLLYNKCHQINPNSSGSYIDSPELMKNNKYNKFPQGKRQQMFSIRCDSCVKS